MNLTICERDILTDCRIGEVGSLFPQYPVIELKRERLRLQNKKATKKYRRRYYDGDEAVAQCPAYARSIEDARQGSASLLAAIDRAGLRP